MPGQRVWRWGRSRRAVRMLEPTLLLLLHRGPTHGYTLLEHLVDFGFGGMHPSIVYRLLNEMEDQGWLSSCRDEEQTQGPPRRVYHVTALGNEVLVRWIKDLEETQGWVSQLLIAYRRHMEEEQGEYHWNAAGPRASE